NGDLMLLYMHVPLTWVVLGIIAVISAVFILVAVYNHFAGTSISAISLIVGAWYWLCAVVYNVIVRDSKCDKYLCSWNSKCF
ncbi:hypothetical protein ACK2FN_09225, partial [Clostridioides difficile]